MFVSKGIRHSHSHTLEDLWPSIHECWTMYNWSTCTFCSFLQIFTNAIESNILYNPVLLQQTKIYWSQLFNPLSNNHNIQLILPIQLTTTLMFGDTASTSPIKNHKIRSAGHRRYRSNRTLIACGQLVPPKAKWQRSKALAFINFVWIQRVKAKSVKTMIVLYRGWM